MIMQLSYIYITELTPNVAISCLVAVMDVDMIESRLFSLLLQIKEN